MPGDGAGDRAAAARAGPTTAAGSCRARRPAPRHRAAHPRAARLFLLFSVGIDLWTDALWFASVGFDPSSGPGSTRDRRAVRRGLPGRARSSCSATSGWPAGWPAAGDRAAARSARWSTGSTTPPRRPTSGATARGRRSARPRPVRQRPPTGPIVFETDRHARPDARSPAGSWRVLGAVHRAHHRRLGRRRPGRPSCSGSTASRSRPTRVASPTRSSASDISFFLFELPFLRLVQGVFNGIVVAALLLSLAPLPRRRLARRARLHHAGPRPPRGPRRRCSCCRSRSATSSTSSSCRTARAASRPA